MASKSFKTSPVLAWASDGTPRNAVATPWGERGAFTTMHVRVHNGVYAGSYRRHCERLFSDLKAQALPVSETAETLQRRLAQWLGSQPEGDYLCRIAMTETGAACSLRPWQPVSATLEGIPFTLTRIKAELKATGWYQPVINLIGQVTLSKQEPLIVSDDERLLEGATSNLIIAHQGKLLTPASDCLPGISLQLFRECCEVSAREIPLSLIQEAEAILCIGSGRQIAPIGSIPEWGWEAKSDCTYEQVKQLYESALAKELSCLS